MIKLKDIYPGRTHVDANDPDGNFLNSSAPGAFDGTPAGEAWARDVWGFLEKVRTLSGIVPSGAPDSAVNSQRYNALLKIFRDLWPQWDTAHTYAKGLIVLASDDKTYQSLQAANTNHDPISSPAWWKEISAVEVIDDLLSTSTVDALSANQGKVLKDLIDNPPPATTSVFGSSLLLAPVLISYASSTTILFSGGVFNFDDGSGQAAVPLYTKNITQTWAAGNAGGLDTGTIATDTTYYCYAIYNPTTKLSDYIFTVAFGAPSLPSGFTKKSYRGPVRTDGGAVLHGFFQLRDRFFFTDRIMDVDTTTITLTASFFALSVPPNTIAIINAKALDGGLWYGRLTSPSETDIATSNKNSNLAVGAGLGLTFAYMELLTNSSSQIRSRWTANQPGTMELFVIETMGCKDHRVIF